MSSNREMPMFSTLNQPLRNPAGSRDDSFDVDGHHGVLRRRDDLDSDETKDFVQKQVELKDPSAVTTDTNTEEVAYNSETVKKARLYSTLSALLDDPILSDVPKKPTLTDVDTLINLELGSAMRISVFRMDNTSFDVAVNNSANVKDLKLAIKKKVNEMEQSNMGHRQISWKHVWKNFCLSCQNVKLLDDSSSLQDHGVRNNAQVHFIPYVVSKEIQQHSKRRKHRFFHGLNRKA